jgi:hypothetical protein
MQFSAIDEQRLVGTRKFSPLSLHGWTVFSMLSMTDLQQLIRLISPVRWRSATSVTFVNRLDLEAFSPQR